MKKYVWGFCWLLSCTQAPELAVSEFIPGTYVRAFEHEFAKGADTLIVQTSDQLHYQIVKRTGFQRIKNGRFLALENRQEKWSGVYDAATQMIRESQHGKVLHFNPAEKTLYLGASAYHKVKE